MTQFTPFSSLIGGILIGLSAVLLMAVTGRIAGISGIVGQLLPPFDRANAPLRAAFVIGLLLAPFLVRVISTWPPAQTVSANLPLFWGGWRPGGIRRCLWCGLHERPWRLRDIAAVGAIAHRHRDIHDNGYRNRLRHPSGDRGMSHAHRR